MADRLPMSERPTDEVLAWRAAWLDAVTVGPDVAWLGSVCGAVLLLASFYRPGSAGDGWSLPPPDRVSGVLSRDGHPLSAVVYSALEQLGVIAVRRQGTRVLGYQLVVFVPGELDWDGCGHLLEAAPA